MRHIKDILAESELAKEIAESRRIHEEMRLERASRYSLVYFVTGFVAVFVVFIAISSFNSPCQSSKQPKESDAKTGTLQLN
jgi:hypothetical protein